MFVDDLAVAARGSGLAVSEAAGWIGRHHGALSGVRGVICHHTGSSSANSWTVVRDGRPGLAGPLAQLVLERDGSVRVLSNGVAWHAGTGSWPSIGRNNGNAWCLGIEAVYDGFDITGAQRDAYPRLVAALCRHYRIPVGNVIGHREWAPTRKWDPGQIDLPALRRDVQALVDRGPRRQPGGIPTMIERPLVAGRNAGTVICPTGSASAIVERAWVSVRAAGGATVNVWFQISADSDGPAPGAGPAFSAVAKSARRVGAEIPSGTEYIEYAVDAKGPGALCVELKAK